MMTMRPETVLVLTNRIRAIEAEIDVLHASVDAEPLAANQRQYLGRCFDLLHMELAAVRTFIEECA